jgi:monovalent cation/hydrogen antiporter
MSATISLLFALLVAIVVLATLATRLRLPYAILLVLGGLLFLLIGLQLRSVLAAIAGHSLLTLIWQALLISLAVIAVRLAWVFPAASLPRLASPHLRARDPYPGWRSVAIVAWIGMRGGLSLAAALALPLTLTSGAPFPQRDLVIFFTFAVILVTLVGQGLSLSPIIRLLGLEQDSALEREHALVHLVAARAALSRLDELTTEAWVPEDALLHLRSHYQKKLEALTPPVEGTGDERAGVHAPTQQRLQHEVLRAERAAVIGLRDRGRIDDETLRLVERELDLEEQRLY